MADNAYIDCIAAIEREFYFKGRESNMKEILVMSFRDCIDYILESSDTHPYSVISIQDSQNSYGIMFTESRLCKGVLTLYFDDIMAPVKGLKLFSRDDAIKIERFIEENKDTARLIIHCYAGESRSSAIAEAIRETYKYFKVEYFHHPYINKYVYNAMLHVLKDE